MSGRRIDKLQMLILEEVSKIIDRKIEFPEGALVTITKVSVSPDKNYAGVFASILGKDPKRSLAILQKNVYAIQRTLNRKMRIRPVPRIRFELDEQELRRERVEKKMAELKKLEEM